MKKKTKKTYRVRCEVNMDASREATVVVVATKPELACRKAEQELRRQGFFYAWAKDWTELDENGLPVFEKPNK